jgi:hypothetical protein
MQAFASPAHPAKRRPRFTWQSGKGAMAALLVFLSPLIFLGIVAVAVNDAFRNYMPRPMDDGRQERAVTAD